MSEDDRIVYRIALRGRAAQARRQVAMADLATSGPRRNLTSQTENGGTL